MENLFKNLELFSSLTSSELSNIISQAKKIFFHKEEVIIKEGELADSLYVIEKGSVQVFTKNIHNDLIILARLDHGKHFGEHGYLNNYIRTASVRALTDTNLIKITYDSLDPIFKRSNKLRTFLEKNSLQESLENLQTQLKHIDDYSKKLFTQKRLFSIGESTTLKHLKAGEIIFKKGDLPDNVYFVSSGSVQLLFDENKNDYQIIINKNEMFGELGVLEHKPRSATAKALTETTLIAISGKNFVKAVEKTEGIKSLALTFKNAYALPKYKALVEQFLGKFQDNDAILSRYKLHSNKIAECVHVINQPIFIIKILNESPDGVLEFQKGDLIQRKVMLKNDLIISISSIGEWDEINFLCEMLLNEIKIQNVSKELFEKSGNMLSLSSNSKIYQNDIICNCMVVPYQTIKESINKGCTQIEQISNETGACTGCGSCKPKILDMLGTSSWSYATIRLNHRYNKDTSSFLISPLYKTLKPFSAGQYISVKLQIDCLWIERTYSILPSVNSNDYEIIIRKYDKGKFSPWLFENAVKPVFIWISSPGGNFLLKESNQPIFCFAGGIGITPFISFIREIEKNQIKTKLHILYSCRINNDILVLDAVKEAIEKSSNVEIDVWDSSQKGSLDENTIKQKINEISPEYIYICGPQGFQDSILSHLRATQFDNQKIITEEFVPAAG